MFSALRNTLLYFYSLIYMCKYQSWFKVNQCWISAVQRWKSNVSELRNSALNNADSELFLSETALFSCGTALNFSVLNSADSEKIERISSETELISANLYHVLWISAEKRQNYGTALFSADYLWDFNPGEYWDNYWLVRERCSRTCIIIWRVQQWKQCESHLWLKTG